VKNKRSKHFVERTYVRQNPGLKPPKYVEYAAETPEEAARIRQIATDYAEKHGLKITVTDIEVHPSARTSKGEGA
jgi:hypothetical protein